MRLIPINLETEKIEAQWEIWLPLKVNHPT
jgi:hypothetical protein